MNNIDLKLEANFCSDGEVEIFEYAFVRGRIRLIGEKRFSSATTAVEYIQIRMGETHGAQEERTKE